MDTPALVQIGGRENEIPQLSAFAKNPDAKAVVALIESQGEIGRLTAGPPGIPPPVLKYCGKLTRRRWKTRSYRSERRRGRAVEPLTAVTSRRW